MFSIWGTGHYDNEINRLKGERLELAKKVPLVHKTEVINNSIAQYCEAAKVRYTKCFDFETKRQFLLDYIEYITFWNDRIEVHGSVPVKAGKTNKDGEQTAEKEVGRIEFGVLRYLKNN